jgi:ABC-2 type transport system permease protein
VKAIFKREVSSYFLSPVAYVVLAIFYFLSAIFFVGYSLEENSSLMTGIFKSLLTITIFVVPIITMKIFSDDKRQKTDQALLTAPIKLSSIVFGKFFAAMFIFFLCISITLVYAGIIACYVAPDWPTIFGNFLGLLLLGTSLVAIGTFISSLTENQIVAAMGSFSVGLIILFMDNLISNVNNEFFSNLLKSLSFTGHYKSFPLGMLKLEDIIFFLSVCGLILFLTARVFEKKRWS